MAKSKIGKLEIDFSEASMLDAEREESRQERIAACFQPKDGSKPNLKAAAAEYVDALVLLAASPDVDSTKIKASVPFLGSLPALQRAYLDALYATGILLKKEDGEPGEAVSP